MTKVSSRGLILDAEQGELSRADLHKVKVVSEEIAQLGLHLKGAEGTFVIRVNNRVGQVTIVEARWDRERRFGKRQKPSVVPPRHSQEA